MNHIASFSFFLLGVLMCVTVSPTYCETGGNYIDLDPLVLVILGEDEVGDYSIRQRALSSIPKDLSSTDAEALYRGIVIPHQPYGLTPNEWYGLYNDVLNVLNNLEEPLPNYAERLLKLVSVERRDKVLRDYALQHFLSFSEYHLDPNERGDLIQRAGELSLAAQDTSLAGTYLLGIYKMADKPGYPSTSYIAKEALELASDSLAYVPNRISAIQICGQLEHQAALPLALELAQAAEAVIALRAAAIATIGNLSKGDEAHIKILTDIKNNGHTRLRYAAKSALKNI